MRRTLLHSAQTFSSLLDNNVAGLPAAMTLFRGGWYRLLRVRVSFWEVVVQSKAQHAGWKTGPLSFSSGMRIAGLLWGCKEAWQAILPSQIFVDKQLLESLSNLGQPEHLRPNP